MPMYEIADTIRMILTYAAVVCAAVVGVVLTGVAFACGARMLAQSAKKLAALSLVGAALIGGMVVVGTDDAGAKPSTNVVNQVEGVTNTVGQTGGGTNDWTNVEGMNTVGQTDGEGTNGTGAVSGPLAMGRFGRPNLMHGLLPSITDDDIVAGWREVSRSIDALAASVFARPDDAFVWEAAMARGARRGYWRIPFDGWDFPGGGASWTNGFVWAEGMFRPRVDSKRNGFLLLDHHLALAPAANWSRFGLDASLFWCRTNAVGGLVGTFLGAAVDDDPAKIVNAQFELFPSDGRIALRYDLARAGEGPFLVGPFENGTNHFATVSSNTAEIVFQRVHPDDWDMDGIPNSMDDDPRVAAANGGWNQSEAWAMLAFPSNAAEIAAMGYMAWATARAEDPNRRLVGLHVSSSDGAWPVLLTFGDKKVMCDCKQELVFAIDCGAKYSYSVSGGRLDRVTVHGEQDYEIHCEDNPYIADDEGFYPHYCSFGWPCDLDVHLESPGCGYLMRAAEVQLEDATPHFFVDESHEFSAVVTNCHHDAYVGCTWSGGEGMAFSDANSLHTLVTWQTTNSVAWATNKVTLVTTYSGGYAITNGYVVTVGSQLEPTSTVTLSCPAVQFLNDGVGGDRKERYYPVTVTLLAAPGVGGIVHLHCEGQTDSALFWDADGSTPYSGNYDLELGIPTSGGYVSSQVFFMKSSLVGRGSVHAALNLTDGPTLTCSTPFQVIEPLRRMVTNERWGQTGPIINPPCLVMGTNAVFKVSVRGVEQGGGGFSASNIVWSTAAGSVRRLETLVSNEVSYAFVEPLGTNEEVTIEARFNNDAIQPRFRLPVYTSRVVPVRAFIVDPPLGPNREKPWRAGEVTTAIANANDVFSQIGVSFELLSVSNIVGRSEFWNLQIETDALGNVVPLGPIMHLLDTHKGRDCIELYFVGSFSVPKNLALQAPGGIVFSRKAGTAMAHELGHALGLYDAYCRLEGRGDLACASAPVCRATFTDVQNEIPDMRSIILDWGEETGRGFYAVEDTVEKIVGTLLMHGYNGSGQIDIPGCSVISLDNNSVTNSSIYVPVGIDAITKNNEDVVSQ